MDEFYKKVFKKLFITAINWTNLDRTYEYLHQIQKSRYSVLRPKRKTYRTKNEERRTQQKQQNAFKQ